MPKKNHGSASLSSHFPHRGHADKDQPRFLESALSLSTAVTRLPDALELRFQRRLATFEKNEKVMTAETLLAPIELLALARGRKEGHRQGLQKGLQKGLHEGREEGLKRGAVIGRIQTCQDLLRLPVAPMADLAEQPTKALRAELVGLEGELRRQLRGVPRNGSNGALSRRR